MTFIFYLILETHPRSTLPKFKYLSVYGPLLFCVIQWPRRYLSYTGRCALCLLPELVQLIQGRSYNGDTLFPETDPPSGHGPFSY